MTKLKNLKRPLLRLCRSLIVGTRTQRELYDTTRLCNATWVLNEHFCAEGNAVKHFELLKDFLIEPHYVG